MIYIFLFWWKASGGAVKNENMPNQVEELNKPIIIKFGRRKVYSPFMDKIWRVDLADMQLITKFNKGIRFFIMCYWHFQ